MNNLGHVQKLFASVVWVIKTKQNKISLSVISNNDYLLFGRCGENSILQATLGVES